MRLNMPLYNAVDSPAKIRLLSYLLSGAPVPKMSERELARVLGLPSAAVNRAMALFQSLNLVAKSSAGGSNIWEVKEKSYSYDALKKIINEIKENSAPFDALCTMIRSSLGDVDGVLSAVIFGSVARKEEKPDSDIDLFIKIKNRGAYAAAEEAAEKLSGECVEAFGNMLSAYILTEKESCEKSRAKLMKEVNAGIKII